MAGLGWGRDTRKGALNLDPEFTRTVGDHSSSCTQRMLAHPLTLRTLEKSAIARAPGAGVPSSILPPRAQPPLPLSRGCGPGWDESGGEGRSFKENN